MTGNRGAARRVSTVALLLLALSACATDDNSITVGPTESRPASSTPTESPAATCDEPAQSKIDLVARNIRLNFECLVVPAGDPLQVEFVNRDFVNHNFSILTLEFSSAFTGDVAYPAEKFRYKVPALEAGQYLFQCDIHSTDMSGPLIVE